MVSKNVTEIGHFELIMKVNSNKGFSLIELLLVCVIIGIIAAVAIPGYQKSRRAAENGTTFANLRTISSTQMTFYSQNNRFARLGELQAILSNALGTTVGDKVFRASYTFEMNPPVPTDAELSREYTISASRQLPGEDLFRYEVSQTGRIVQVQPAGAPEN